VDTGDELVESQILDRGARMNGLELQAWREPYKGDFDLKGARYQEERRTELAQDQVDLGAEWAEVESDAWISREKDERVVVTQGAGADCSVVAGMTVCLEHNRRWKRQLAREAFYPRTDKGEPRRSDSGRHVVKLLLNGCWRSVRHLLLH
jgi:calpain-7